MQDDNSMVEKILLDLENVFSLDDNLKQFDIVPVNENNKNKSPVLYEEHNVGLELWCVKHVYSYIHSFLLKFRKQIKSNLSKLESQKVNRLLMGAVLIQSDAATFWNMRRDLIELNLIGINRELMLTKLVLSYKSKSNEAFSHRRWVVKKLLKNCNNVISIIEKEFQVADMACQKAANNYHAWTYKIWLIETIPDIPFKSSIIKREFTSSLDWIFLHVSEHSGFHYRQRLFVFLQHYVSASDTYFRDFKQFVGNYLHIARNSTESILKCLLGEFPVTNKSIDLFVCVLCVLLFELLYTCLELNKLYPGHESIWYHRRFVLYRILETLYNFFELDWGREVKINDANLDKNTNIIEAASSGLVVDKNLRENGEKHPKLFKSEPGVVESTIVYKLLLRTETDFINNNKISSTNNNMQVNLAKRHETWMKHILQIRVCS